jgi:hypothetical protein
MIFQWLLYFCFLFFLIVPILFSINNTPVQETKIENNNDSFKIENNTIIFVESIGKNEIQVEDEISVSDFEEIPQVKSNFKDFSIAYFLSGSRKKSS